MREAREEMAGEHAIRKFEDLRVYQSAVELAAKTYQESALWNPDERFGIVSQVRRAAVSVALNIAEGYGRKESAGEMKQFLRMALGSCNEVIACLDIVQALSCHSVEASSLRVSYEVLAKQLYTLAKKWK
jgi:four helix bundle protein